MPPWRGLNWRCTWSSAPRRTATRSAPSACGMCRAARSTWCPGAASFRWTCARHRRPARRAGPRRAGTAAPDHHAARSAAHAGRNHARRRRAQRTGLAAALGARRQRPGYRCCACPAAPPRRHEAARGDAPGHAVRAGRERGISHNPLESTTHNDMQLAVEAFSHVLHQLRRKPA